MNRSGLSVKKLDALDIPKLAEFCDRAGALGHANNSSLSTLKIDKLADGQLAYWLILRDNEIVGITGCQRLVELGADTFRVLFRSCVLPGVSVRSTLARSSFESSALWSLALPKQIQWGKLNGGKRFVITVNCPDLKVPIPRSMIKVGRVLSHMEKQGHLELLRKRLLLFGVHQDVYLLKGDAPTSAEEML